MSLYEQNKRDIEQITTDVSGFSIELSFTSPNNDTATIRGQYTDHSNAFDESGLPMTGKMSIAFVSEQLLIDASYPTRTTENLITLTNHKVTINYADGTSKRYVVAETRPDYTINFITLFLSEYNGSN